MENVWVLAAVWVGLALIATLLPIGPFLGCTAIAHFVLHWTNRSSWLAGEGPSQEKVEEP